MAQWPCASLVVSDLNNVAWRLAKGKQTTQMTFSPKPCLDISECIYTSCYCEENIWHLAKSIKERHDDEVLKNCFVVFISNPNESIPLWRQKAGKNLDGFVVWDYHVIFLFSNQEGSLIYDFDTTLSFPCSFEEYIEKTIQPALILQDKFQRLFRVIPAQEYLDTFASDRSHMLKDDGSWMKPPPLYPPIQTASETHNLSFFKDMNVGSGPGEVFFCHELIWQFTRK